MRGAGVGGAAAQVVGGLARLEQAALRHGQALVRFSLLGVEVRNRRACFILAPVERLALLLGLVLLARELLRLLGEPHFLVGGVLQLRVVADHGLFLLVVLRVQGRNRLRGVKHLP